MGYDKKYKERVLSYLESGHTQADTSAVFGVGTTTIKRWMKRQASGEGLEARKRRTTFRKIDPEKLRAYVAANPDAYEREIATEFGCARSAVQKALKRLGITRKKRR